MLRQSLDAKHAEIGEADDYIPILYHTPIIIMVIPTIIIIIIMTMILYIFITHFCYDNGSMMYT